MNGGYGQRRWGSDASKERATGEVPWYRRFSRQAQV
jgi:hypothetical protein